MHTPAGCGPMYRTRSSPPRHPVQQVAPELRQGVPFGAVSPTPVMTTRGRFIGWQRKIASQPPAEGNTSLMRMNVLVVGGAGYIGSHCVRQLAAAGHRRSCWTNLVYGHRAAVAPGVPFHEADLGDEAAVGRILRSEKIEVVMHFAAYCYVGESVTDPLKYYLNNVAATLHLLKR